MFFEEKKVVKVGNAILTSMFNGMEMEYDLLT